MKALHKWTVLTACALLLAACDNLASGGQPEEEEQEEQPKDVSFSDLPVKASIKAVVTGGLYEAFDGTVTVTLNEDERFLKDRSYPSGMDVGSWFNIDLAARGLSAKTKSVIAKNGKTATIGISGITIRMLERRPLVVAIPAEYLQSGEEGRTQDNEDAYIEIGAPVPDAAATAIRTAAQLASIGAAGGLPLDGSYVLANDIDVSAVHPWPTIGSITGRDVRELSPFTGVFDGNGHRITGLKLPEDPPKFVNSAGPGNPEDQRSGLFGFVKGATVKNLTIELAQGYQMAIAGGSQQQFRLGGLVGQVDGGIIAGVTVKGTIDITHNASYPDNNLCAGGVFGYADSAYGGGPLTITGCVSEVILDIKTKANVSAGGFGGEVKSDTAAIMFSRARGSISGETLKTGKNIKKIGVGGYRYFYGGFISQVRVKALSGCSAAVAISVKNILHSEDPTWSDIPPFMALIRIGGFAGEYNSGEVTGCSASGDIVYSINREYGLPPAEELVSPFIGKPGSLNLSAAGSGTGRVGRRESSY